MTDMNMEVLPPAIAAAAASLTHLQLRNNVSPRFGQQGAEPGSIVGLAHLPLLTSLRCLELQQCDHLPCVPAEISKLTNLNELDLSWSLPGVAVVPVTPLNGLLALNVLAIRCCQIRMLDGSLQVRPLVGKLSGQCVWG
jgi:hypothetical protein